MLVLKGIAASPGIVIGPAFVYSDEKFKVDVPYVHQNQTNAEVKRFEAAVAATDADLTKIEQRVTHNMGAEYAVILTMHKAILHDPSYKDLVRRKIKTEFMSAENALFHTLLEVTSEFEKIKDPFFRERKNDIYDVAKRMFDHLAGNHKNTLASIKVPSIIVAHNLFPSDTLALKDHAVLGFATDMGGKTSHTALLAQSLEIPAIVGMSNAFKQVQNGTTIIVDGEEGLLIVSPDGPTLSHYKSLQKEIDKQDRALKTLNTLSSETLDGKKVNMMMNFDPRTDGKDHKKINSDGLGLLRTEFLFMDKEVPPSEKEQIAVYTHCAKKFHGMPVHIRLADLGGDKVYSLNLGEDLKEENPFMGLRGVRLLLKYPSILKTQLRAIIKTAAAEEAHIKIIVPMVCSREEVKEVKKVFLEELRAASVLDIKPKFNIEFGVMVEVPSAVFSLDAILQDADFVSIGTNDLIQYMLAVDRVNQNVASLYDPYNPSVLRVINIIIQAVHAHKKTVSICGELASDTAMVPLLVGLGLDTLSTTPRMFFRIKNRLRNLNFRTCSNLAQAALLMTSSEEIKRLSESVSEN